MPAEAGDEGEVNAEGVDEPLEGGRGVVGERFDEVGAGEIARGGFGVAVARWGLGQENRKGEWMGSVRTRPLGCR